MPQCSYAAYIQMYAPDLLQQQYMPCLEESNPGKPIQLKDYGPQPFAINMEEATNQNRNFRLALWTGQHLQLTLMSINPGEDIGLEIHPNLDQFIRIEQGRGLVKMGDRKDNLYFQANVKDDFAFIIPAGAWHNLINTGNIPLKLYSIYAPPQHPFGTVHKTKKDAE
jgi:mannose-6-phosphate isomerase-like protein (cupin superfamily)